MFKRGYATVKLENASVVDSVAERHLETSLPSIGGHVMVIHGERKGETATLIQKLSDTAIVQFAESLEIEEINLDWVAGVAIDQIL